jgi:hypothetical protein
VQTTTLLDNDQVTLLYYPEHKIVHHTVHQPPTTQMLREMLTLGTETLRENGADKWLSDDRKLGGLTEEDNRWGEEVWFPQTQAAGWKYWALIVPNEVQARGSMIKLVQHYNTLGVLTKLFVDLEPALDWLKSL